MSTKLEKELRRDEVEHNMYCAEMGISGLELKRKPTGPPRNRKFRFLRLAGFRFPEGDQSSWGAERLPGVKKTSVDKK